LLSHPIENEDLMVQLLADRAGRRVELAVPQRGEKAELVENAVRNARESFGAQNVRGQHSGQIARRLGRCL
jgi:excinuclease ABC subunit C